MKRILFLLAMAIGIISIASAKDTYVHSDSVLPQAARTTLANNFKAGVSVVKIEKELGRVSEYEVILTNGTEITFDRNGNWENIETAKTSSVPSRLIPEGIRDYVSTNLPGLRIVGIDKERSGYEVELANGLDLKFNKSAQFLRYDN